jgi:hypothetical protein
MPGNFYNLSFIFERPIKSKKVRDELTYWSTVSECLVSKLTKKIQQASDFETDISLPVLSRIQVKI